jgi:hypothetical protein
MRNIVDPKSPKAVSGRSKYVAHRETLELGERRPLVCLPVIRQFVSGLQRRDQEGMLVLEMVVYRAGADAGGFRDLSHGDAIDAGFGNSFVNDAEKLLSPFQRFGTGRFSASNRGLLGLAGQFEPVSQSLLVTKAIYTWYNTSTPMAD